MQKMLFAVAVIAMTSGAALAADLAPAPVEPVVPVSPAYSWTGFYVGVNAGAAWSQTKFDNTGDPNQGLQGIRPFSDTNAAFAGGIQAGYNYQIGNFVLGVEGSADYVSMDKGIAISTLPATGSATLHSKQEWLGAAGLRLGYALDRILVYASGGVAFTSYDISTFDTFPGGPFSANYGSKSEVGWTAGAGIEYALTDSWVLGLDYKYYGFGKETYNSTSLGRLAGPGLDHYTIKMDDNVVTARVSYKF